MKSVKVIMNGRQITKEKARRKWERIIVMRNEGLTNIVTVKAKVRRLP
jgi:hypothetical protein